MATYENRLLFRQIKNDDLERTLALESIWAYTIQMGDSHPIPGRYRIRVVNIDFVEPESLTPVGTQILCVLEKWTNEGWLDCLEYMPESPAQSFREIETELNLMFKSFTTGTKLDKDYYSSDPSPIPVAPPPNKPTKTPKTPDTPKIEPEDFDWI